MALVHVEVQGRTEVEWAVIKQVEVPDAVLAQDDPDALSEWVETNVSLGSIPQDATFNSELRIIQGVDLIN